MFPLFNTTHLLPLKFPSLKLLPSPLPHHNFKSKTHLTFQPNNPRPRRRHLIIASTSSAYHAEIDMVKNTQGVYAPKPKKVVVLWDLDNKPPRGPPYNAATSLIQLAQNFGELVQISAYANHHAFIHLPHWVLEDRRNRRHLDILERKGIATSPEPYICGVCGRKCKTNLDLKKHFKQLHEREREKKVNRLKSLKGKKRQRFKERYVDGNYKYLEAARSLITPKVGYGLGSELRRAGVSVKTVKDKPQAADWELKRQIQHSMSRGIDWLVLVSDDSDFSEMLRRARESNLGTVVVGDWDRALGRHADLWVPWMGVENGEITEQDLMERRGEFVERNGSGGGGGGSFSVNQFEGGDLDSVVDELVSVRTDFHNLEISGFSDGEEEDDEWINEGENQEFDEDGDFLLDSDDGYF